MTDRSLKSLRYRHRTGITVLAVSGELDLRTAPRLAEALEQIPLGPEHPLVIDLTDLTYCDSTGVTVLITAHHRAQQNRAPLVLAGLGLHLTHLFEIIGLDQLFTIGPSADEAAATLRPTTGP